MFAHQTTELKRNYITHRNTNSNSACFMFNIFGIRSTGTTFWRRSILRQRMDSEYVFTSRQIEKEYSSGKKPWQFFWESKYSFLQWIFKYFRCSSVDLTGALILTDLGKIIKLDSEISVESFGWVSYCTTWSFFEFSSSLKCIFINIKSLFELKNRYESFEIR